MSVLVGVDAREWVKGKQTGIGRYLETILQRALEVRPGWRWVLFVGKDCEERIVSDRIEYHLLPTLPAPLVDQISIPAALRKKRPDLFYSPYIKGPWRAPCPTIVTVHDLIQLRLPPERGGIGGLSRIWFRSYLGRSLRQATAVVSVSSASAADAIELMGVPGEKIEVIYEEPGSVFSAVTEPGDVGILEGLGIGRPYCLVVGNFKSHKNIRMLLHAWSMAVDTPGDAHLVMVGRGEGVAALRELASELGIAERLNWVGSIPESDLAVLYRNAVTLLQPSLLEGFGLPVLEAMSCGTPALVSSGGSLPEVQGEAGPVLDPDDAEAWSRAIVRILSDETERNRLAEGALRRASEFSAENTTDRLIHLLEESAR